MQRVTAEEAQSWLVEKLAIRLEVEPSEIDVDRYFDEFDLDSTEALILAGELEKWLGFELEATALWYHPTIAALSEHIAEENARHATAA
ncbi:acyl carrier protein [Streptomyces pristinaespiralis]|jgi:acyl carrier protein|uniref:AMP-dependent synthetase and ligase n=3 Tax=Streptomyces TaxID=1883 RepID=B5HAB5_STRE2|nr:acyl carrier protein [Streptomyces pristinaespiralis]ALC21795.1 polyketide synthase [Streptomyces pristinaespiralis]EDY63776.1 AMP-dependent synthetase and ligase [Streptomyces pristinaespiralis ATCC 25486]QMU15519.1 acyl carrier protein [Streptomyces pristinaespiralis]